MPPTLPTPSADGTAPAAATRLPPVIKWPGSKRAVAPLLGALLPPGGRFFDPFVGGGALLPFRSSRGAVAGDVIPELVRLWEHVRLDPDGLARAYAVRWRRLQAEGPAAYYHVRAAFNRDRRPADLLFLSRTCVNGLIRFNTRGAFNNSLHHTRPGVAPDTLRRVLRLWSGLVRGVRFRCGDYRDTLRAVRSGDVVFLDPPYEATSGRYHPAGVALPELEAELDRLNAVGARWLLTYDGTAGVRAYDGRVAPELYRRRLHLRTGHSPFTRLMRTSLDAVVETVYLNY